MQSHQRTPSKLSQQCPTNSTQQTIVSCGISDTSKRLDEQFVLYMLEIENRYRDMTKHEKIRVEQWVGDLVRYLKRLLLQSKVLCQVSSNAVWKRNRNLYCMLLLDQILIGKLEKPFTSMPPDGGLPLLPKTQIVINLDL